MPWWFLRLLIALWIGGFISNYIKKILLGYRRLLYNRSTFLLFGELFVHLHTSNFLFDLCSNKNHENICTTILSCLSSTTEDFPQIIFAIDVATKTSQIITPVQIFKALYGIIEPFIRSRNIFIERMLKETQYQNSVTEFMKFFDMIFSFIICLCGLGLLLRIIIIQYIVF